MQNVRIHLSEANIAELTDFLIDPRRPEDTMCFQELQGFLFAVACSPEMVPPSDWLADLWDEYVPESLGEECGSSAMVLSFFASRQLAELYYLETTTTPRHRKPGISFSEFAERVRELFPDALSSYAHLGRTISEVLAGSADPIH